MSTENANVTISNETENANVIADKAVKTPKKSAKNVKDIKKEVPPKKEKQLQEINLQQFEKSLSGLKLKEKSAKDSLYNYPEGWTKNEINSLEGKGFRNKRRNEIERFYNNISLYAHPKNPRIDDLKKEVKSFVAHYKQWYKINDFSLSSISQSNNEETKGQINLLLAIVKEVNKK